MKWAGKTRAVQQVANLMPLTRWLVLLAIFNVVLVNAMLMWTSPGTTALDHTARYFKGYAADDSWKVMNIALDHLSSPQDEAVYSEVFFNQGVKFQYPLTSLLPLEVLRQIQQWQPGQLVIINRISWVAVLVTGVLVARIFTMSVEQHLRPSFGHPRWERLLLWTLAIGLSLTFYPIIRAFTVGQIQVWINCLFAAALLLWISGRPGVSGALCGVMCVIKPQLGLLLLWALIRKRYRFSVGWALAVVPIVIVSVSIYGIANHLDYLNVLSYISRHGESFYPNQSVNGLLHRLLFNGNNVDWSGGTFAPFHPGVYAGTLISSLALISLALFWRVEEHRGGSAIDLSIAALSFTIASPVAWEHHYGIMLPIFAVALPATLGAGLGAKSLALLAVSFVLSSNFYNFVNQLADTPFNFLQSYLFFAGLILLVQLYILRRAQHQVWSGETSRGPSVSGVDLARQPGAIASSAQSSPLPRVVSRPTLMMKPMVRRFVPLVKRS